MQIELSNIYKRYGKLEVVHGINLQIKSGEFLVLVGPSGCGKSTTLRMIAGLEDISEGNISINGRIVNSVPPKDRNIAFVFQNYALYPHMNVYENMSFSLKLQKAKKEEIKNRVDEVSKILNLEPYLDRKPSALSGGNGNEWRWVELWFETLPYFYLMNPFQI